MLHTLDVNLPIPGVKPSGEELFRRGLRHATGVDAPVNLISAHALFDLAARLGSLEAKVYRKELGVEMDPSDVAEAQRVVRDWLRASGGSGAASSMSWQSKPNLAIP